MTDFTQALTRLRRPQLLIRAARFGMANYNRKRDLRRLTRGESIPAPESAVRRLMDLEAELEYSRRTHDAAYSPSRHVDILIALMAEARALVARGPVAA